MSCLNYGWFLVYWCISRSYLILQSNPLSGRCVNDVNEQDCGRFVQKPGALLGRLTRSANYSIILSLPENASSTLCLVGDWFFQSGQIDPVYVIHPIKHFGRSTCYLIFGQHYAKCWSIRQLCWSHCGHFARVQGQTSAHRASFSSETFSLGNKEAQRPNVSFIHLHQLSMKIFLGPELMAS